VTKLAAVLQGARAELAAATAKAEQLHDDLVAQAEFVTGTGCAAMEAVRQGCDALEVTVGNDHWPLPRYREMLFPV
jgi:glutamine synthetase